MTPDLTVSCIRYIATFESCYPDNPNFVGTTSMDHAFMSALESAIAPMFPNAEVYVCMDGEQYITWPSFVEVEDVDGTPIHHADEFDILMDIDDIAMNLAADYFPDPEDEEGE